MPSFNSLNRDAPIGIFDSGVGGISIANAITKLLPNEEMIYVADSANAPYGEKSPDLVLARCQRIIDFLISQKVKLIVVACNTATLTCIGKLRSLYAIDFVGVEPGIKPALHATQTGVIGVMATANTLRSPQYAQLQKRFSGDKTIVNQACKGLVEQIENLHFDDAQTIEMLQQYLDPMLKANADHIVLGCTHYGFLSEQIGKIVGEQTTLINTSEAIAKQVENRLIALDILTSKKQKANSRIYSSQFDEKTRFTCETLWHGNFTKTSAFDIN